MHSRSRPWQRHATIGTCSGQGIRNREMERCKLNARTKLNLAYLNGSGLMAAAAGVITGSWAVFAITLVVFIVISLASGDIRPPKNRRSS
jgi:hypothetical protein